MSSLDDKIERGVSRQIEEAQKKGAFDNLPGKGKPLKLNTNPHLDPDKEAAYHLLNENDFVLPWMEKGRQIERDLDEARKTLAMTWDLLQRSDPTERWARAEWARATEVFRTKIALVNRMIRDHNIEIPNPRLERFVVDAEGEIERVSEWARTALRADKANG